MAIKKTSNTSLFSIGYIQLFLWLNWTTVAICAATADAITILLMLIRLLALYRFKNNMFESTTVCDMRYQSHWKINNAPPKLNLCNIHFLWGSMRQFSTWAALLKSFFGSVLHSIHTDSLDSNNKYEITPAPPATSSSHSKQKQFVHCCPSLN